MGNYKTKEFEINAFRFYYDEMPNWFQEKVHSRDVILFNCDYDEYGFDEAFCIINANKFNKRILVSAGEYILESDYDELIKMHPDNFINKYEKK